MFEKFSDYMYSLLFTPLKKIRQAGNQFYLFFKVVGKLFDDTKTDIFRVREESIVASASEVMLPEHGYDRNMPRLQGESLEGYRCRLSMKAILASKAGTREGILLSLAALGCTNCFILPTGINDRWAEFYLIIDMENLDMMLPVSWSALKKEVMDIKPASSLPLYILRFTSISVTNERFYIIRVVIYMKAAFNGVLLLDGSWYLDGTRNLGPKLKYLKTDIGVYSKILYWLKTGGLEIETRHDLWYLDGAMLLDGSRKLESYIETEEV